MKFHSEQSCFNRRSLKPLQLGVEKVPATPSMTLPWEWSPLPAVCAPTLVTVTDTSDYSSNMSNLSDFLPGSIKAMLSKLTWAMPGWQQAEIDVQSQCMSSICPAHPGDVLLALTLSTRSADFRHRDVRLPVINDRCGGLN